MNKERENKITIKQIIKVCTIGIGTGIILRVVYKAGAQHGVNATQRFVREWIDPKEYEKLNIVYHTYIDMHNKGEIK